MSGCHAAGQEPAAVLSIFCFLENDVRKGFVITTKVVPAFDCSYLRQTGRKA